LSKRPGDEKAVARLMPYIIEEDKITPGESSPSGKIILATVKGDVQTSGKYCRSSDGLQ